MLTPRDEELLDALLHRVKVFSVQQVWRRWWPGHSMRAASARLRVLADDGWIEPLRVLGVQKDFEPQMPLFSTRCGGPEPVWREVLRVSRTRWHAPLAAVSAVVATPLAARTFGGFARYPRPSEATHDLFLSAVFLSRMTNATGTWTGEGTLAACAGLRVVPDALLSEGREDTAVEVVGSSYTEEKLLAFHQSCRLRHWGYELW